MKAAIDGISLHILLSGPTSRCRICCKRRKCCPSFSGPSKCYRLRLWLPDLSKTEDQPMNQKKVDPDDMRVRYEGLPRCFQRRSRLRVVLSMLLSSTIVQSASSQVSAPVPVPTNLAPSLTSLNNDPPMHVLSNPGHNLGAYNNIRSLPPPNITSSVGNGLSSPVYVNLYWDTNWDADNPSMPKSVLDSFTASILKSSYFGGLAEYGVGPPSFGGGFLPQWNWCTPKAPTTVGFYDPSGPSIMGFLQCELQHGGIPQGPQVVYNIILPTGSLESDFLGNFTFCKNAPGVAWHFHQTPYTPEAVSALLLGPFSVAPPSVPPPLPP